MREKKKITKTKIAYPLRYHGNKIILVLCLIIWLPLGFILLMKNGSFLTGAARFYIHYHGDYCWLFLWSILFFPIAMVLLLLNGADLIEEAQ